LAARLNHLRLIPKIRRAAVIRIPRHLFQRQQMRQNPSKAIFFV
jgi:hypothetical protein